MVRPDFKAERNAELWRLKCAGHGDKELAERFGISEGRVCQIVRAERAKLGARDRAEIRQELTGQLDTVRARLQDIMDAPAAVAMSAGKPVPARNEDGSLAEGQYAVDHGAALSAASGIVQVQARMAKMLGLDDPTQIGVDSTVRVIVEGTDDV